MRKITLCLLLGLQLAAHVEAQKLPSKQKNGLWAPADIKVDGLATEWKNQFQAYNNAIDAFYTISNDDKNIYLILKVRYRDVIDKILRGGITFAVAQAADKNKADMIKITYPVLEGADMSRIVSKFFSRYQAYKDSNKVSTNVDELNELFEKNEKLVDVANINGIDDPTISVYNEMGIKTAARFDNSVAYTYELAMPLKYLKLESDEGNTLRYNIKINAVPETLSKTGNTSEPIAPPPFAATGLSTTDVWGEYVLAKK